MTALVEVNALNVSFSGERTVHAVNDISLSLGEGEVLGLLGESGSGKSVTLRALMRLLPRKRTQISGTVKVLGRDVLAALRSKLELDGHSVSTAADTMATGERRKLYARSLSRQRAMSPRELKFCSMESM